MRRLLPRSLAGQMALLLGVALLVAQLVNFALILNERQKLSLAQNEGPAITRFVSVASDLAQAAPAFHALILADSSHRGARFMIAAGSGVIETERDPAIENRLQRALSDAGLNATAVRAGIEEPRAQGGERRRAARDMQFLRLAMQRADGSWLAGSLATPRRDPWLAVRLGAATLLLYLIVLGATIWLARRIARPLHALTRAAERFQGQIDPLPVVPAGPADLRLAIDAFNAMNRRMVTLIDEKDRMLGAIGHDLRTPLASLRIRVESMEPEEERIAAIAKIGEMSGMLEDILALARSGRAREESRRMDVAALADGVVEEFADRGLPVRFDPSARAVLAVQPVLLRRALRNLIENAINYGGDARVSVVETTSAIEIRVADSGPGIPPDERERVLQPFYRLERSRNRDTGGSGLGLAIAQSVAQSHGGRLVLGQGVPTGLIARLCLPRAGA